MDTPYHSASYEEALSSAMSLDLLRRRRLFEALRPLTEPRWDPAGDVVSWLKEWEDLLSSLSKENNGRFQVCFLSPRDISQQTQLARLVGIQHLHTFTQNWKKDGKNVSTELARDIFEVEYHKFKEANRGSQSNFDFAGAFTALSSTPIDGWLVAALHNLMDGYYETLEDYPPRGHIDIDEARRTTTQENVPGQISPVDHQARWDLSFYVQPIPDGGDGDGDGQWTSL